LPTFLSVGLVDSVSILLQSGFGFPVFLLNSDRKLANSIQTQNSQKNKKLIGESSIYRNTLLNPSARGRIRGRSRSRSPHPGRRAILIVLIPRSLVVIIITVILGVSRLDWHDTGYKPGDGCKRCGESDRQSSWNGDRGGDRERNWDPDGERKRERDGEREGISGTAKDWEGDGRLDGRREGSFDRG
jgi:hypothetical protein